jgi:hypothetical protein
MAVRLQVADVDLWMFPDAAGGFAICGAGSASPTLPVSAPWRDEMRRTTVSIVAALGVLAMLPGSSGARTVHPDAPFITSQRPMLVGLEPGVDITPIINAGELIGGRLGGFQLTGVPDGIGVYRSSVSRLEVFVSHETAYEWGDASDARVSHLSLNLQGKVVAAGYAIDGTEGYQYFCSSTMDTIRGVPWYFTG